MINHIVADSAQPPDPSPRGGVVYIPNDVIMHVALATRHIASANELRLHHKTELRAPDLEYSKRKSQEKEPRERAKRKTSKSREFKKLRFESDFQRLF